MIKCKVANIVLNDFTNDSRVLKTSQSLIRLGFSVTVVALYNRGLNRFEKKDNIFINRIKLISKPWPKFKIIQIIKYLEFVVRAVILCRDKNIFYCNDLNALPVGLLVKFFYRRVKVIYDCHEYETEIKELKGLEKKLKKLFERSLIYFADDIITVSNSIANEYSRIYRIRKPYIILNCPFYNEQSKSNHFRENFQIRDDQTIFLYQGGFRKGRGLEILLDAFYQLDTDDHVLVCMGYGPLEKIVKEKSNNSSTIYYFPAVQPCELLNYTSSADYGILFYEDNCLNHRYCSPNKIFEYLMAGLPVITSNLYEMKNLVETSQIGVVALDNTVNGFKDAIDTCLNLDYHALQQNVYKSRKKYCWENQEKILEEIFI